jgi:hypothetical protein
MKELAESADTALSVKLQPLVDSYSTWIAELDERRKSEADLQSYADAAENAVAKGEEVLKRLKEGIAVLDSNADARDAFRFANEAMWRQRVRSVWIEEKKAQPNLVLADVDVPKNRSWRAFQLAFCC